MGKRISPGGLDRSGTRSLGAPRVVNLEATGGTATAAGGQVAVVNPVRVVRVQGRARAPRLASNGRTRGSRRQAAQPASGGGGGDPPGGESDEPGPSAGAAVEVAS